MVILWLLATAHVWVSNELHTKWPNFFVNVGREEFWDNRNFPKEPVLVRHGTLVFRITMFDGTFLWTLQIGQIFMCWENILLLHTGLIPDGYHVRCISKQLTWTLSRDLVFLLHMHYFIKHVVRYNCNPSQTPDATTDDIKPCRPNTV